MGETKHNICIYVSLYYCIMYNVQITYFHGHGPEMLIICNINNNTTLQLKTIIN